MPFSTDTTWPAGLQRIFDVYRRVQYENRHFGPYTKLLTYCFGDSDSFDFFVGPQVPAYDLSPRDTDDFFIYLIVFDAHHRPVLIADVRNLWVELEDQTCFGADDQIRQRFNAMAYACPLPRLWGLSILGTSLRVYVGNVTTGELEPPFIGRADPDSGSAPEYLRYAWNIDILSQEGFIKMKEIVDDIITNTTALEGA